MKEQSLQKHGFNDEDLQLNPPKTIRKLINIYLELDEEEEKSPLIVTVWIN